MLQRTCWLDERMTRKRILLTVFAALALFGTLSYFYAGHQTPASQPRLAELNQQNFTTIENSFNAAKDDIRILLLLSPT
jgi:hypothetical protein